MMDEMSYVNPFMTFHVKILLLTDSKRARKQAEACIL